MVFGKVKQFFGIEGVKIELELPEEIKKSDGEIYGKIRFTSMNTQTVVGVKVKLIEKYIRGRRKGKKMDEYELGFIEMDESFTVEPDEAKVLNFVLPFELLQSEMDAFGDKNPIFKGISKVAKATRGVKSRFRIEAEANVKGTRLNPFDEKEIKLM